MSAGSLFSPDWYRVAELRPQLRPRTTLARREMRGSVWHLAQDPQSGQFYRLSPAAYLIVCLLDGRRTVREAWELAGRRHGAERPSQDETIHLLAQLHRADLLLGDLPPDVAEVARRGARQERHATLSRLRNPLAMRFALFDPDAFLTRALPLVRPLLSPAGFVGWLALVLIGAALALAHWNELTSDVWDRVFTLHAAALALLTYPLVKAAHELGHAFVCKQFGGAVHEMGVMLLVLFPVPYVDATKSTAFPRAWQRALVGATGIMVELALASLAMLVWLETGPGLARAAAFNVMLIGGVSTLIFNGNPLLRFDGYYVLCDLIGLPNLSQKSGQYVLYLIRARLLCEVGLANPAETTSEARWYFGYAIASTAWRIILALGIALLLASRYMLAGGLLGAWSLFSLLALPLIKGALFVARAPGLARRRRRAILAASAMAATPVLLLFALPVSNAIVTQGVVRLPETALIRAHAEGVVSRLLVADGTYVHKGQPLAELDEPTLPALLAALEAEQRALALRRDAAVASDRVTAALLAEDLNRANVAVSDARSRLADLTLRAPSDGVLALPEAKSLPGRFVRRGDLLGQVRAPNDVTVRVVVAQEDIDQLRTRGVSVSLRLAHAVFRPIPAVVQRELPAAVRDVPSAVLSLAGGGEIATDPADANSLKAFEQSFLIDVAPVALEPDEIRIGERAHVRFDLGAEPVGWRVLRGLRALFLRRFDV